MEQLRGVVWYGRTTMVWVAAISGVLFCYCVISLLFPNSRDLTTLGLTSIQLTQRKQANDELTNAATPKEREDLLLRWLLVAEDLPNNRGFGVDPWYYQKLASYYQAENQYVEELQILQRFQKQPHTANLVAQPLLVRLRTVKQLAAKRGLERVEQEMKEREQLGSS